MPVHVYGNPCYVEKIQEIADIYGLKLIYDAAHAFGVKYKGGSILNYGDLSILSFHATKVFNTFEGGAIISHDSATKQRIDFLKNFGFAGETTVMAPGINSKMNEVQAAMGLLQLKSFYKNIEKRKVVAYRYRELLKDVNGISLLPEPEHTISNYAYFPIFVSEEEYGMSRDALYEKMKMNNIFGRRYFYPLISEFPMYRGLESSNPEHLPIAHKMANKVICLPIYPALDIFQVQEIIKIIT
jgi:dTDP-4-amino-4,6-dideoxygalactose transaminase